MSSAIPRWLLSRSAFLAVGLMAGVMFMGAVGAAQQPCPSGPVASPTPVATAVNSSADEAVAWFKAEGLDDMESIETSGWSAIDPRTGSSANIVHDDGNIVVIWVNESALGSEAAATDMTLLPKVVARFAPVASAWLADALATSAPGSTVEQTFGDVLLRLTVEQVVGSPMAILWIEWR